MDTRVRPMKNLAGSARPHFIATRFSPSFGSSSNRNTPSHEQSASGNQPVGNSMGTTKSDSSNTETISQKSVENAHFEDQTTRLDSERPLKSTTKMSSRGPVSQEFTNKGTTPSGKPRLFVCDTCTRAFARQEHLKRHERSHTKEKPFACNICSRKFSRRDLLLRHSTKLHAGAADVIPRLRKRSTKYVKNEDGTSDSLSTDGHYTLTAKTSITNPSTDIPVLYNAPDKKLKGVSKRNRNNSVPSSSATSSNYTSKRKLQSLLKNSEGLQLSVLPEDIATFYNTLDNQLNNNTQNIQQQAGQQTLQSQNQGENQLLDNMDFNSAYRRASFSAMSGNNYAAGVDMDYATETVEFSTPQYYSILDDLKTGIVEGESAQQPNNHASYIDSWISNTANDESNKYKGYSFYNELEDSTTQITEDFGRANLNDIPKNPFKKGSQLDPRQSSVLSQQIVKLKNQQLLEAKAKHGVKVDEMNLKSLEELLNTKFPHPVERSASKKSKNTNSPNDDFSELPPLSPIGPPRGANQTGPQYWRSMGVNGLLSGLYGSIKDSMFRNSPTHQQTNVDNSSSNPNSNSQEDMLHSDIDHQLEHKVKSWQETLFNQPISNFERLNDMHVSNQYGIPQGYSFYGEYESSSQQPEIQADSEATISPILLESPPANVDDPMLDDDDDTNLIHQNMRRHRPNKHLCFEQEFDSSIFDSLSHVYLFTSNTRVRINDALAEYPYTGVPTPIIPEDETLNGYVDQFINKFLTHHPFVHKAALNEYSLISNAVADIKRTTISVEDADKIKNGEPVANISPGIKVIRDEEFNINFRASLVCLPFLVTTLGAIVSNKKEDAASLYEASRRCIHVYLETRRKLSTIEVDSLLASNSPEPSSSFGNSPLWLIQSLALSVIYGLFADEEISLSVIIRQVHALNTLLKSSGLNCIQYNEVLDRNFFEFIKYESTIRTIHMVFHVSTLLSTLYNIVPSLTVSDMKIDLPCSSSIWDCYTPEDYLQIVESFDFKSKKFHDVLRHLVLMDLSNYYGDGGVDGGDIKIDESSDLHNFFFDWHVSEFGLTCIQNALHQMAYFHNLGEEDLDASIGLQYSNGKSIVSWSQLRKLGKVWNSMVNSCKLYNESSEVFNDNKILNHYLNLKLCSIVSLNKIKESVWLKSFNNINEEYYTYFNYGDNELKDQAFQNELIGLITNSIDIMKLVFFNDDISLMGSISEKAESKNETINQLDSLYLTPPAEESHEHYNNDLNTINLNILHKLSIDSQILFDVILIIVKFLISFENIYKLRLKFNNLSAFTFLDDDERVKANGNEKFDKLLFRYYVKFFKIYLSLEQFMKINYEYEDFETEQPISGNPFYPIQTLRARGLAPNSSGFDDSEIDRVLRESRERFMETGQWIRKVVSDDVGLSDMELIMNELIGFKLPYKFLKIGGFLFGFIYDRNFKFVNFRHLSDVLFHLRVFLESKDEDIE